MVPGIFPSQLEILSTGQTYFEIPNSGTCEQHQNLHLGTDGRANIADSSAQSLGTSNGATHFSDMHACHMSESER